MRTASQDSRDYADYLDNSSDPPRSISAEEEQAIDEEHSMDPHRQRQAIPVIRETAGDQSVRLFALFQATRDAGFVCPSIMIHADRMPSAGAALQAWADSLGLVTRDQLHIDEDGQRGYATKVLDFAPSHYVAVIAYRPLTDVELLAMQEKRK